MGAQEFTLSAVPYAVTYFNATKTKPAQNSRQNPSIVFNEFDVDGAASIARRALKNLYPVDGRNPLRPQIGSPENQKRVCHRN
jgi:hypothetical protein